MLSSAGHKPRAGANVARVTLKNPWHSLSKAERILVAINTVVAVAGSVAILLVVGAHRGDWRGAILIAAMMLGMTAVVLIAPPWKRARDAARAND